VHSGSEAVRDLLPRLAAVSRAENIWLEIFELMPVDGRIRQVDVEVRRLNHRHTTPRRDALWRHVLPRLAVVPRHLHEPVVGSDPDGWREQRRWCNRV